MSKAAKVLSKCVKGAQFTAINGYENEKGEISNYLIVQGYNHEKMKKAELAALLATNAKTLSEALKDHAADVVEAAYNELIESRQKPTKENAHAMGQIDAYITLANGVKYHKESGSVKLSGLCMKRKTISYVDGFQPAKEVKSNAKTLAKRAIERLINKQNKGCFGKIVMFTLEKESFSIRMQKMLIES